MCFFLTPIHYGKPKCLYFRPDRMVFMGNCTHTSLTCVYLVISVNRSFSGYFDAYEVGVAEVSCHNKQERFKLNLKFYRELPVLKKKKSEQRVTTGKRRIWQLVIKPESTLLFHFKFISSRYAEMVFISLWVSNEIYWKDKMQNVEFMGCVIHFEWSAVPITVTSSASQLEIISIKTAYISLMPSAYFEQYDKPYSSEEQPKQCSSAKCMQFFFLLLHSVPQMRSCRRKK